MGQKKQSIKIDYKMRVVFNTHYEKKKLAGFWSKQWNGKRYSIDDWLNLISDTNTRVNLHTADAMVKLKNGLKKMHLEKWITEQELNNLTDMLESSDDGNKYMALLVMKKYKKTKFKR